MAKLAADLQLADVVTSEGADFAAGYADGYLWCEVSTDRGAGVRAFRDLSLRKRICAAASGTKPTILVYDDRVLQVWFGDGAQVVSYGSEDGGETWFVAGTG